MLCKINDFNAVDTGKELILTLRIPRVYSQIVDAFKRMFQPSKEYELKQCRKKRSLNANDLMWYICTEIANAIGQTKEYVYRDAIAQVGVYDVLQFTDTKTKSRFAAMETFKLKWKSNGTGWLTKTLDKDKCIVQAYYGSSRYDTKEMSILIDHLKRVADDMGIVVMTEAEIDLLKREWK